MPVRENSRRAKALAQLDIARDAIEKAISLLGGRVRVRSVKSNQRLFTARQYLESIDSRLNVTRDLLQIDEVVNTTEIRVGKLNIPPGEIRAGKVMFVDDFERDYDSTRRPDC